MATPRLPLTPCHTCRLRHASLALQWHPRRELAARQAERGTCARPTLIWVMQNTQESNAAADRAAIFVRNPTLSRKGVPNGPTTMMFIFTALLVSIFVSHDYGSGFIRSIFTVHARRVDYVISKTPVGVFAGSCMVLAHFWGSPWRLCSGSRGSPLWNGDRCSRCCATWAARCGSRAGGEPLDVVVIDGPLVWCGDTAPLAYPPEGRLCAALG